MRDDESANWGVAELNRRYRDRSLSPVELVQSTLDRIERVDPRLNAFCLVAGDEALAAAKASEDRWSRGEPLGPLDGIPATIKDMTPAKDWPTRSGSQTTPTAPSTADAPVVARLRTAGAVLMGKTTTPEFGWKGITDSPLTGVSRNPWNPERTCGGSSGGAGIAAATGLGVLNQGTDGAGSIRMPAGFCGVFGLKPTFGRVAHFPFGLIPQVSHSGPITRTVADAALMMNAVAGPDPRDWQSLPADGVDYTSNLEEGIVGLRIAYSPALGYADVDPEVAAAVEKAAEAFAALGATVDTVDPGFENPRPIVDVVWKSGLAAIVEGTPDEMRPLMDPGLLRMAEEGLAYSSRDVMRALLARDVLGRHMNQFHQTWDLLLTPNLPLVAFAVEHDEPPGRGMKEWLDWSPFHYPFNLTQQPAATMPCGLSSDGLPISVQLVGPRYGEALVLRACRAFERAHPFEMPDPARFMAS